MSNIPGQFNSSNPEGIVSAPKGARFSRKGNKFFLTTRRGVEELNVSKKAFVYGSGSYRNAWFPSLKEDTITFSTPYETWIKTGEGINSTGWRKIGNSNSFVRVPIESIPLMGDIENVFAGSYFTHFLKTNGDLYSAGENYDGQLGLGDTFERGTASLSLTNVKFVAKGVYNYFSAAVKNDGTLLFTGNNGDYQFGNGTSDSVNIWTTASLQGSITGSGNVKALALGQYYTAMIMDDDTLWIAGCDFGWCDNYPVQVDTNVKEIAGGGYHLLYVKNDDTLFGIGDNWYNQLGSEVQPYYNYDEPFQIDTNVKSVGAGGYHSHYIKNDNTLWGMGANWDGQIGNGLDDGNEVHTPVQIDTNVSTVVGGDDFTLYIKTDKTLWGMGYAGDGALGLGTWDDVYTPVQIDTDVEKVTAGDEHSLYVKSNKMLYGMGYNWYFPLGGAAYEFAMFSTSASSGWTSDGVTKFTYEGNSSDQVYWKGSVYADGKFVAVGGEGYTQAMYSTDGKTWLTSSLDNIEMGLVDVVYTSGSFVAISNVTDGYNDGRPEVFTSTDGISWQTGSLTGSNWHELNGITYGGGQFVAVGDDRIVTSPDAVTWTEQTPSGDTDINMRKVAYGNGTYAVAPGYGSYSTINTFNVFTQSFNGNTVSQLSAGAGHACVVKDGILYGAGYTGDGQLNARKDNFIYFYPLMSDVRNVTCYGNSTLFVKNDNTLWGMGYNSQGQLGDGTQVNKYSPVLIDTDVSASFAGPQSSLAVYIKNDGTLWGMGLNFDGKPFGGTSSYVTQPMMIDTNVVNASTGEVHIIYIKNDTTVWTRGHNDYGQLGDGTNTDSTSSIQIDVSGSRCSAVRQQSFYIKTDGSLYSMGYNGDGQLGLGDYSDRNTPTQVTSSGVTDVSAGYSHTLYLVNNGDVYGMGSNNWGQIGDGTNSNTNVPVSTTANNVKSVHAGGYTYSYVVRNDNTIFFSGGDYDYQAGISRPSNKGEYSTDGVNWSSSYVPNYYYNDVVFGNGKFVMVADDDGLVVSSTDGIYWTSSYITTSSYVYPSSIIHDGTKFVACAYYGDNGYNIYTSTDAVSWSMYQTGQNNYWGTIAYGDGKYILLSNGWNYYINPKNKITI